MFAFIRQLLKPRKLPVYLGSFGFAIDQFPRYHIIKIDHYKTFGVFVYSEIPELYEWCDRNECSYIWDRARWDIRTNRWISSDTNNHLSHLFIITKNVETATLAKLTYCGE